MVRDLLPHLFRAVGPEACDIGMAAQQPTLAQSALLDVLCMEAQDMPQMMERDGATAG
jgi:hypothetical protein